ncbi:MAG: GerMN domain-containing protein [Lachnospiraceae bacterium]|nr:GerMN domain-containing protein [Lachnospiraceae bacterium]
MKKRLLSVILCFLLLFCMACGGEEQKDDEHVIKLYYVGSAETKVVMQEHVLQAKDVQEQLAEIVAQLSTVPEKLEYKPPLAMGFSLNEYRLENGGLVLDVDEKYKELKPTTEVLVRAALVRSFTQLPEVSYVSVTVAGAPLHDNLGNVIGLMSADQFIDNAGSEINTNEKVRLKLYFANEAGNELVTLNRTLDYNTNISMEKLVVEQILAGIAPAESGGYPTLNSDTKIISVAVKDGICYVNFDQTFLTPAYSVTPEVALYSLVNSLTELSGVNKVQISINGETNVMYMEKYSLTTIFERNLDLIVKEE